QTWERQDLPTKGTIHALQFLTPYTGFAAGREEVQATGKSAAVLLKTEDGGLTWKRIRTEAIPGLRQIAFENDKHGTITTGPGDIYETKDGGIRWQATGLHHSFPEPVLTPELYRAFRCRGYTNRGWMVGTPGSVVVQFDKSQTPIAGCMT